MTLVLSEFLKRAAQQALARARREGRPFQVQEIEGFPKLKASLKKPEGNIVFELNQSDLPILDEGQKAYIYREE